LDVPAKGVQIYETTKKDGKYLTEYLMELPSTYASRFFIDSDKLYVKVYQEAGKYSFKERNSKEKFPKKNRIQIDSKNSTPTLKGGILHTFEIDVENKIFIDLDYSIVYETGIDQSSMHTVDPYPDLKEISVEKIQIHQRASALNFSFDLSEDKSSNFQIKNTEKELKLLGDVPNKLEISKFAILKKLNSFYTFGLSFVKRDSFDDELRDLQPYFPLLYKYEIYENVWKSYFIPGLSGYLSTEEYFRGKYSFVIDDTIVLFVKENGDAKVGIYELKI
jgi:hypothetical protein